MKKEIISLGPSEPPIEATFKAHCFKPTKKGYQLHRPSDILKRLVVSHLLGQP